MKNETPHDFLKWGVIFREKQSFASLQKGLFKPLHATKKEGVSQSKSKKSLY